MEFHLSLKWRVEKTAEKKGTPRTASLRAHGTIHLEKLNLPKRASIYDKEKGGASVLA